MVLHFAVIILSVLFLRLLLVLLDIYSSRKCAVGEVYNFSSKSTSRHPNASTLVVLGSGGHTSEMLKLLTHVQSTLYKPMIFVIADTDTTSASRLNQFSPSATTFRIPRSREVGQSYTSSIITTLWSLAYSLLLVFKLRPDLVLCNGPGTCLPVVASTLLCRILGLCRGKVVFVESFCRVTSLSLTGLICYNFVDQFIVHWSELQEKYPMSLRISTMVRHAKE